MSDPAAGPGDSDDIRRQMLTILRERGPEKTACPSEVARRVRPEKWRDILPDVRRVAAKLQKAGRVEVTQGGEPVDPQSASGPIRLGLPG